MNGLISEKLSEIELLTHCNKIDFGPVSWGIVFIECFLYKLKGITNAGWVLLGLIAFVNFVSIFHCRNNHC